MILKVETVHTKIIQDTNDKLSGIDPVKELKEYLKIKVDGYFHSPAFKKRRWDGTKSFVAYSKFLTGFLPFILNYCEHKGFKYTIEDLRPKAPKLREDLIITFGDKTLAAHQIKGVRSVDNYIGTPEIYFPHGVFDAATNAGKTLMVEGTIVNFEEKVKCLYLVHGKDLFSQAVKDFSERHNVGYVNKDGMKFEDITVCMNKTLLNRAKGSMTVLKKLSEYDMVVVDECHHACGGEYEELLKLIPAPIRIFCSGTPRDQGNNVKRLTAVGLAGKNLVKITNKELIDIGFSLKPLVRMHLCSEGSVSMSYDEIVSTCIHYSKERLDLILGDIEEREGKSIVVSCSDIMHGEFLLRNIAKSFPEKRVEFIHGEAENREQYLEEFKEKKIDVLIASMIIKEGLNIPNIETIIRAEGGKSKITTKQLSGRGMRKDGDNTTVEIIDFMDIGKYIEDHSRKRARDYIKEGFEFEALYPNRRKYISV